MLKKPAPALLLCSRFEEYLLFVPEVGSTQSSEENEISAVGS
jgi:hypothetical protein